MQPNSIEWQSYAVLFRHEGKPRTWVRFAPNETHAITAAQTDLTREYPDATVVSVTRCPDPRRR